jgi:high affinity sulfate transporter 1
MTGHVALHGYQREWLRPDLIAGLTAAAVVIPKAMAFATIARLPVQVGLYTALVPMVVYALLGTSRPLSVSTTTTIAVLTGSALATVAHGAGVDLLVAAATLAVMVGLVLLAAWVLRLGFVANFISEPVLVGFKSGIGFVIVVDQLPKLLGVHIEKTGFLRDTFAILTHLPQTSLVTLAVSAAIVVLIFGLEHFVPRVPAPLVAVAAAVAASALLDLPALGVATVGAVPTGLPSVTWPDLALVQALWLPAVGIALMSFTESIAAARAFAERDEPLPEPNRELFALGVANAAGGLLGAMPAGGGTSQTAINRLAGARSQAAELVTAASTLATLLLLAPSTRWMPQAALAAVVIRYSLELIQPKQFLAIRRVRTTEFRWSVIAFAGVILLGTLQGIVVAVMDSLLSLAQQAYNPPLYAVARKRGTAVFRPVGPDHPDDESWPGLLLLRIEGRLFFANAQRIADLVWAQQQSTRAQLLVIDCRAVIDVEYTAIKVLEQMDDKLRRNGCELWLAGMTRGVFEVIERSGIGAQIGHQRMFLNLQAAVETYERRSGHEPIEERATGQGQEAPHQA